MIDDFPVELTFTYNPGGYFWMLGQSIPTRVKGYGRLTLMFDRTDRSKILSVSLRDIHLEYLPLSFPIDLDKDGKLEYIELDSIEIDTMSFDLETSKGTLDLETGDIEFILDALINPNMIPLPPELISQLAGDLPLRYRVIERGKMDFLTGEIFYLNSGLQVIEEGFLAGMKIFGMADTSSTGPVRPWVKVSVAVSTPGSQGCGLKENEEPRKEVIICKGDSVNLCWRSSNDIQSVDIEPGRLTGLATHTNWPPQWRTITPNYQPPEVEYVVKGNKDNQVVTRDSVKIKFYDGAWIPGLAQPTTQGWTQEFSPLSISRKILIEEIQIETKAQCLAWNNFSVVHFDVNQNFDFTGDIFIHEDDPLKIPKVVIPEGRWFSPAGMFIFSARKDPERIEDPPDFKDIKQPVCFRFKGHCPKT